MTDDELDAEAEAYIAHLVEVGALEIIEAEPENLYRMTPLTPVLAPEYYAMVLEELDSDLQEMFELGLINIEYDENLEATFYLTDLGREVAERSIDEGNGSDPEAGDRG